MKKDNKFLDPISEERKSRMFIGDRFSSISSDDANRYNDVVESPEYASAYRRLAERVIPAIDIREPGTWAIYGSAEKYYRNSFEYIHNSYPYDGSALEKVNWSLSASVVDLAVLQHEYPLETGHVGFSTSSWGSLDGSKSGIYGLSDNPEYIKFSGGPYVGTVLDSSTNRESSLKINPSAGNTVEFWLRKKDFIASSKTESEIVFDSHTIDFGEGNAAYGRMLLELSASSGSPLYVTYMSGTAGADRQQIGQNITTASVADNAFHHYAITAQHTGSNLNLELYVDGVFNHRVTLSVATMGAVNGYFNASLGALRTTKDSNGGLGYGKLSGSIDEFRFWKVKRTAEQIGNYFDFPVHGATDTESISSNLGVYFKFNEGITGNSTTDKVVLDYSGRLNNGEIVGYATGFRARTSAITLSSVSTQTETGDPIVNPLASRVKTNLSALTEIGKAYDEQNHSSLFKSVPQWAYDVEAGSSNLDSDFSILLQAMAQKFDSIRMLISGLPKIGYAQYKDYIYAKGTVNYNANFNSILGCEKDFDLTFNQMYGEENFSVQNLLGRGFTVEQSPITSRADLNEYFYNLKFGIADAKTALSEAFIQSKVENTKNKILNSIYANLSNIYKTKGTYESFRNLIRCFGVDESLLKLNVYGQNVEKVISNSTNYQTERVKSIAFTGSNRSVTLFQTASSTDERAYVTGSPAPASITTEAKVLFPHILDPKLSIVTASVFGSNDVTGPNLEINDPNNAGFRVVTIKSGPNNTGCYFRLTSSAAIFDTLTSDYFSEVYSNTPWYIAVKFTEDTKSPLTGSDNKETQDYKVEFIGYRYDIDVKTSEFHLTSSITAANYENIISANKSYFLGADRTNITGTVVNNADSKLLSFSVWDDNLSEQDMKTHAQTISNLGRTNPLFRKTGNQGESRLQSDSLVMNWQFDNVQDLNSSTSYIYDHASGSVGNISKFGDTIGYKYPAVTHGLQHQPGVVQQEFLPTINHTLVDNMASDSKISIKAREIDSFEIDSRPVTYLHTYEKSMYQVISKEMLNMLAGITSYNNLIGEPVYKYRQEYKSLEKLRERFFSKVENDIDLERFIEYYKWIDSSLASLLQQLQPATADMNLGLQDVVESHALERSKYKHQAPQFEYKDPKIVGQILGVNELLYDWEHGHPPLPSFWASFDGTDDFIDVPDSDTLSFGDSSSDSAFSLSAWVVYTNPGSNILAIMGKYNENTASEYLLFNNNGYLQANLYDLNTSNRLQSKTNSVEFEEGVLYHIVMTYDGSGNHSGLNLYIDGVQPAQTRETKNSYTAMHNTTTKFQIGSTVAGTFDFARNMHHAMVFDAELTSDSVSTLYGLYNQTNAKFEPNASNFSAYSDLVSWWKMDKKDRFSNDRTAHDSIGSNEGTYNGDANVVEDYFRFNKERDNCLWWADRAERDGIIKSSDSAVDEDKEKLRQRANTIVSGSTYVLRKLSRPYKFSGQHQNTLNIGSNRKANKNKSLYKPVVASGQEIEILSSDIYEFKQCNDVLDPQEEKIYTAKTNTTGTEGYLDADADMILPFSLYSSSVGTDFSTFKRNLKITNNHDDDVGILQSPFLRELVGGMPHRRVKFGTPDADRPEAYILVESATKLTLKHTSSVAKSYTPRGSGVASGYNIANVKTSTTSTPITIGNYTYDYDIVMTNGRNVNNSYLIESGSIIITPVSEGYVYGLPDFTSPVRGRAEHIIVNQFSSPGGPETQGVYGRDKESGEFSIYNTLNYRNDNVRSVLNKLSAERSEQFGYRSGSSVNASVHMVNRNFFHMTTSLGEVSKPDNQFVQHPIPQNDFGYSWITASAVNSKFEFVEANDGFGHQHLFSSGSAKSIQFLSQSQESIIDGDRDDEIYFFSLGNYGTQVKEKLDFSGLNLVLVESLDKDTNTFGNSEYILNSLEHFAGSTLTTTQALADTSYLNPHRFLYAPFEFSSQVFGPIKSQGDSAIILNSIILNRQGPYGWPTWKQLRGGEHPIARAHRKSNTFSRVFLGDPTVGVSSIIQAEETPSMNIAAQTHRNISTDAYVRARFLDDKPGFNKSRMVKNYIEPIASTKSKPIRITVHAGQSVGPPNGQQVEYRQGANPSLPQYFTAKREEQPRLTQRLRESLWAMDGAYYRELDIPASKVVTFKESFQNDLTTFSNEELIKDIRLKEKDYHKSFDMISNITIDNTATGFPLEISYLETIYPREANVYTENARERVNFDYFPWNSSREVRNLALTGNVVNNVNNTLLYLTGNNGFYAFSEFTSNNLGNYKNSIFGKFDVLRLGRVSSTDDFRTIPYHITSSTWVLDSRKDFTTKPVDITTSFLNDGNAFLVGTTAVQGTLGEGLLQNDFSTFPLGMNNLYGTPPISLVYNRRIPQPYGSGVYLSGEAKWEAADNNRGPFYDSYSDYSEEIINVAPDHSIVPEFRMSEMVEDTINGTRDYPNIGDDFLTLTGAIYQNSSGDVSVGGNFFKTYSNSDFLKYFSLYDENTIGDADDPELTLKHARINLKCKAAMKFLPYKGFYPAERAVELARLFNNNYLSDDLMDAARIKALEDGSLTTTQARRYAKLRANASRYQASKPLFGPGLLLNSIKSGIAVDYPIFSGSFDSVYNNLPELTIMTDFSTISMPSTNLFTGSLINGSLGASNIGIPRLTGSVVERIQFEDLLSPTNIFGKSMYDNEPHPSASLIYGDQHFHKIIERPGLFGRFDENDAQERLGITFLNTRRAFSRQMSSYTMASRNFAAETVNFFLEDGHLTTAISKPIRERFEAGTYKMRVHLNNINTVMYDRHSAFGPPVDDSAQGVSLKQYTKVTSNATSANFKLTFNDISGSGGTPKYTLNNTTGSHQLPQLIFTDDDSVIFNVFLHNEDYFSAPSGADYSVGDNNIYYAGSPRVDTILQRTVRPNEHVALVNVKNALGSEVATSINTVLTVFRINKGFKISTNRSSNILAVTSSNVGPRTAFGYFESAVGDGQSPSDGTQFLRTSLGLPKTGSFVDDADGVVSLHGNIYSEAHSGETIDIINDGASAQPTSFTTSTTTSTTEHGFAPYVPPFLDPNAEPYVEITFTPTESRVYGAPEIIEKSTYEYYNFHTAPSNASSNTNYKESMSLSASLNLGMCVTLRTDNVEQIEGHQADGANGFNLQQVDPNNLLQRWVIQTKWETPVMDFSNVTASAYNLQTDAITQVSGSPWKTRYWDTYYERGLPKAGATTGTFLTGSTGMWHQKGTVLNEKDAKGYFLTIKDVDGFSGLAEKLGFNIEEEPSAGGLKRAKNYRNRIGLIEDRKIVKEAIVAIPYVVREDLGNKIEFVRLSNAYYQIAKQNVEEVRNQMRTTPLTDRILTIEDYNSYKATMDIRTKIPTSDAPIDAIEYQLFMMDEYILPPQFDFTRVPRNAGANDIPEPFMMYFFQFHASFNREDLSNIWQNLYPKSAGSTASPRYSYTNEQLLGRIRPHNDISYVSHYLETVELNGLPLCPADDPRSLFSPSSGNKTRWMVFKVKQRGLSSLEKIRRRSIDPREENIESLQYLVAAKSSENRLTLPKNLPGRREDGTMDLQFNWPYDYFSFVELIKLDAKIDSFNYLDNSEE